jgi:UPF0042 nucleotide-binding protein
MSGRQRVVLVSGLSGAGKFSILRALEDLGYDAIDNPPLNMIEQLIARGEQRLAIGVDARSRGFDATAVLHLLARLREAHRLQPELIYASAEDGVLLRRYTQSRRRHPLAPLGRVVDGIAAERSLTSPLMAAADLVVDTSELPLPALRRMIECRFGDEAAGALAVSLISFAYPAGLPREADMVFDARFLRNPHYDPELSPKTGLDAEVAAYVEADPDFRAFFTKLEELLRLVLPRFVQEGKKYATIGVGCTGGRHRSVRIVEKLAGLLAQQGWRVAVTHRELGYVGNLPPAPPPPPGGVDPARPDTARAGRPAPAPSASVRPAGVLQAGEA